MAAPPTRRRARRSKKRADTAGAWLLGARATKLDAYLRSLRDTLDPLRIMNPGTLRRAVSSSPISARESRGLRWSAGCTFLRSVRFLVELLARVDPDACAIDTAARSGNGGR